MSKDQRVIEGDQAPDFEWVGRDGRAHRLAEYRGRGEVVLFFYPKDNTPGCTAQACSFRNQYAAFVDRGVEVVGISSDGRASHEGFAGKHQLPYALASDVDGSIRERYGVPRTLGLLPGRVSYLVDRRGVVRSIYSSQFRPASHVPKMLEALDKLRADEASGSKST